jgi:hypothetical protein
MTQSLLAQARRLTKPRTQAQVLAAWLEGRAAATPSGNLRGEHRADGSGELRHYRTIEAIRTRTGLVINNSQCWAGGWAKCTKPNLGIPTGWTYKANPADPDGPWIPDQIRPAVAGQADTELPLNLLEDLVGLEALRGIRRILEENAGNLVHLEDGTAAYVGWDRNPDDCQTQCFAFQLTTAEAHRCRSPTGALQLLKPVGVRRAEAAGLKVRRQGEWFFVPTTQQPRWVYRRGKPLDNHAPLEWGIMDADPVRLGFKLLAPDYASANPSGLPAAILSYTTGPILDDWAPADLSHDRAGRLRLHRATRVLVRGCVRHRGPRIGTGMHTRPQHTPLSLGSTWHVAVTHGRVCVTWDGRRGRNQRRGFD